MFYGFLPERRNILKNRPDHFPLESTRRGLKAPFGGLEALVSVLCLNISKTKVKVLPKFPYWDFSILPRLKRKDWFERLREIFAGKEIEVVKPSVSEEKKKAKGEAKKGRGKAGRGRKQAVKKDISRKKVEKKEEKLPTKTYLPACFLLEPVKRVRKNPLKLPEEEKAVLMRENERYKEQYAYVVFLCKEINGKWTPVDAKVIRTYETLMKIVQDEEYRILLHPQPVSIPKGFWEKWKKKAKTKEQRLKLVKETGLVKDENIFVIIVLVLDVDSPYEEVEPVFLELVERLGIQGWECGKTKSGNFRAFIYLKPLRVEVGNENGNKKIKTFYLRPNTKSKNGHTHLENAKEILAILNAYFKKKGLKADDSFIRINHPVWFGKGFYTLKRKSLGETNLYDLYRAVKKLQAEEGLWETNLKFWKELYQDRKEKKKTKVVLPYFVAERLVKEFDELTKWRIAVAKLAEKYTSYRFKHVMLPAVGWAKFLDLPRSEVDDYLREVIPDKKNFDVDIEKAWKYAEEIEFEWKGKGKEIDLKELLINFLEKAQKGALRKALLENLFRRQNWLLELVEKFAKKNELVYVEKVKLTRGKGRKAYIYYLTEKGKAFLKSLKERNASEKEVLKAVVGSEINPGTEEKGQVKKSIYITPPFREEQRDKSLGLGVGGKNKSLAYEKSEKVSDNITDGAGTDRAGAGAGASSAGILRLSSVNLGEEKRKEKERRTEKLIKSRWVYAETWKLFGFVKRKLEEQGINVLDSRYEVSEKGLDGRKLLKLIRYLLTNKVEVLNLAGWGRYAVPILEAFKEAGLLSSEVKVVLPGKIKNLKPETLSENFEDKEEENNDDFDIEDIPF